MRLLSLALILCAAAPARAELRQVWDSPAAIVQQTIGITDIAIEYHRPAVKGRPIWGKLVPNNLVWRAGANEATRISFSTPVKIAGKDFAAGTYALFIHIMQNSWTFILSPDAEQWGAYFYNPERDLVRIEVKPTAAPMREWLAYELEPSGKNVVQASLHWEKLRASFPIEVDTDKLYQTYLETELSKAEQLGETERWDLYFVIAKYWILRGERLDDAAALLDKADKLKVSFWAFEYRARLLFQKKQVKEAIALLDKAKEAAAGKAPKDYITALEAMKKDWQSKAK